MANCSTKFLCLILFCVVSGSLGDEKDASATSVGLLENARLTICVLTTHLDSSKITTHTRLSNLMAAALTNVINAETNYIRNLVNSSHPEAAFSNDCFRAALGDIAKLSAEKYMIMDPCVKTALGGLTDASDKFLIEIEVMEDDVRSMTLLHEGCQKVDQEETKKCLDEKLPEFQKLADQINTKSSQAMSSLSETINVLVPTCDSCLKGLNKDIPEKLADIRARAVQCLQGESGSTTQKE